MSKSILLSGGIDSIALLYLFKPPIAVTIDYGQKPAMAEIRSSKKVCEVLNIRHEVITVDCSSLGSGDLLGSKAIAEAPSPEWWPFRNQLLVTLACMKGITMGVDEFIVGSVRTDGFHRDGTAEFYSKINSLVEYQEGRIKVTCPAINLSTVELVQKSRIPYEILLWAHSCHTSNDPCGYCRGCLKHLLIRQDLNLA